MIRLEVLLVVFFIAVLTQQLSADKIYGPVIGSLSTNQHEVRGKVHALNLNTIGLRNFSYDGLGQEAFFWVGDDAAGPSATGRQVPDERGSISPLKTYRDSTLVLILPDGSTLKTIKWFAIWDTKTATNYGSVTVPADLVIPKEVAIGMMTGRTHGVSSGPVTVLDSRTILIQNFSYDGTGPDAFFYVGTGAPSDKGMLIPNEIGSVEKLPAYNKKNITLFLPEGINVYNIDYLSVWCRQFSVNFGEIAIPRDNITAPPFVAREVFIPFPPGRDEQVPMAKGDNATSAAQPMAEGAAKKGEAKSAPAADESATEIDRHVTATNAMPLATSEPMTTVASPASSDDSAKKMAANDSSAVAMDAAVATTTAAVANDAHPAAVADESTNANATESTNASTQPASAAGIPTPPASQPAAAAAEATSASTLTTSATPSGAAGSAAGSARAGIVASRVPSPSIADLAASVASGKHRPSTTSPPPAAATTSKQSTTAALDSYTRSTTPTKVVLAAGNDTTATTVASTTKSA